MSIESIPPTRVEGIAPFGPEQRQMLPMKEQGSELPSRPGVKKPSAGSTVDRQETDKALRELSQAMTRFNVFLKFTRDEDTGKIVIEMIDQTSGQTLLEIPNEAALHVAATLSKIQGKIFNRQV